MLFYSSQYTFDRLLIPEGAYTYNGVWFDSELGHITVKQNFSSTPLISRIVSKLNKTVHMDADGHVKITIIQPWLNKTFSITYTGEFPNNEVYSREITKSTFDATSTMDFEGNLIYTIKDWLGNTLLTWDGDTGETSCQYDDNENVLNIREKKEYIPLSSYALD